MFRRRSTVALDEILEGLLKKSGLDCQNLFGSD